MERQFNPNRQGRVAQEVARVLENLSKDKELEALWGKGKVLENMAVVADNNELRIEELGIKTLTKQEEAKVVKALEKALKP